MLLVALSLIVFVQASTKVFKSGYKPLYGLNTYGRGISSEPFNMMTSKEYRNFVNRIITCQGDKLCDKNYKYTCSYRGDIECYHVMHIFDTDGPHFSQCKKCKTIISNMVMAYGKWNSEIVGMGKVDVVGAMAEKSAVISIYNILATARNINKCCNDNYGVNYFIDNEATKFTNTTVAYDELFNSCSITDEQFYNSVCNTTCTCHDKCCGCDCDFDVVESQSLHFGTLYSMTLSLIVLSVMISLCTFSLCHIVCAYIKDRREPLLETRARSSTTELTGVVN